MIKIPFLILCLQAMNLAMCWDTKSPLILNKEGDSVFFPTYVNSITPSEIVYKRPEDTSVSTYTFCREFPEPDTGFSGDLLIPGEQRSCRFNVNTRAHMYIQEQLKNAGKKPISCSVGTKEDKIEGYQYRVYFRVKIDDITYTQDSYRYCYDQNDWNTLYAYYDLGNPSLLKNKNLINEQIYVFEMEKPSLETPYGIDIFKFYDKQSEYKPYDVAVSDFIPFTHWRISFYEWENKAPMYNRLIEPWKAFIQNIKLKLANKTEPVRIVSGIYGITQSRVGEPIYIYNKKITIPMVWWIVIHNKNKTEGTAFIMHDYIPDGKSTKPEPWCKSQCDNAGLKDVVPKDDKQTTMMYCCPASDVALRVQLPEDILFSTEKLLMFEEKNDEDLKAGAINFAICWDPKSPLILNKKENAVSFPTYVGVLNPTSDFPEITYKDPEDKTVSITYAFCEKFPKPAEGFPGQLLNLNKQRTCDYNNHNLYYRDQLKEKNDPISCSVGLGDDEKLTGSKFRVYFKVTIDEISYTQDSFNFCYDVKNMNTLYAYYDLENPSLLKNEILSDERNYQYVLEKPTLDGPAVPDLFPYYNQQSDYAPYDVAISDFIPFAHWRISFYQWENKAPMYASLINPWKAFIQNIKSKLAEKTEHVRVVSGIYGITRWANNGKKYIANGKITIPKVWWLVVLNKDKTEGTAFIAHNFVDDGVYAKPEQWCESQCDNAGLKDVVPKSDDDEPTTVMYCCSASVVAKKVRLPKEILSSTENLLKF